MPTKKQEEIFKKMMFYIEYYATAEAIYQKAKNDDNDLERRLRRNDIVRNLSKLITEGKL